MKTHKSQNRLLQHITEKNKIKQYDVLHEHASVLIIQATESINCIVPLNAF